MQKKRKGFTLAELLIVVAIIAVLVAISIPIFNSQLKKARIAVDQANVRSAKAAAAADYMSNDLDGSVTYLYNNGKVLNLSTDLSKVNQIISGKGYGESDEKDNTEENGDYKTGASGTPKNHFVFVTIDNGKISAHWDNQGVIYERNSTGDGGKLILTGNIVNSGNILTEINQLNLKPEDVTEIESAKGSTIDNNTQKAFEKLPNLKKIDLQNSTLVHSHAALFSNLSGNVQEIVLPQCASDYDIDGTWYFSDGSHKNAAYNHPEANIIKGKNGTRISSTDSGKTIYRTKPTSKNQ